jgi:outer membrane immunogenic protein
VLRLRINAAKPVATAQQVIDNPANLEKSSRRSDVRGPHAFGAVHPAWAWTQVGTLAAGSYYRISASASRRSPSPVNHQQQHEGPLMKSILLAGLAVLTLSGTAIAADVVVQEPAAAYNWIGGYVGAMAGYAWGRSSYSEKYYPGYHVDYNPDGFIGGAYAGYNWQLNNNIVLGGEADIYGGDIKGDNKYYRPDGTPDHDGTGSAKLTAAGSLRARLGYAADRFMPYATGGVAFGRFKYGAEIPYYGSGFSTSKTFTGWTLGAGIEYAFKDNLIGRVEYRYTDFGKKTIEFPSSGDWDTNTVKFRTNDIRFGIAYKF